MPPKFKVDSIDLSHYQPFSRNDDEDAQLFLNLGEAAHRGAIFAAAATNDRNQATGAKYEWGRDDNIHGEFSTRVGDRTLVWKVTLLTDGIEKEMIYAGTEHLNGGMIYLYIETIRTPKIG